MKKYFDKTVSFILVVFLALSLVAIICSDIISYSGSGSYWIELGASFFALILAAVLSLIYSLETSWDPEQKFNFSIVLLIHGSLCFFVILEDIAYIFYPSNDQLVYLTMVEVLISWIGFYFIWRYISSLLTIDSKLRKTINALQLCFLAISWLAMILGIFAFSSSAYKLLYVGAFLNFVSAVIIATLIGKNLENRKERISLLILVFCPAVCTILYYSIVNVFLQYPIDVLALLLCFINVQFARGKISENEKEFAARVQQSVLPDNFNINDKIEIFADYRAMATVGGDFYDFEPIDDNNIAFLIADVSGHGSAAAMFMMQGISLFRGLIKTEQSQGELMKNLNEILCQNNEEFLFITAWFGILNTQSGHVSYINAGHSLAAVARKDGSVERITGHQNFVLAVREGITFQQDEFTLNKGDTIFIYTDGVNETHNAAGEQFGIDRVEKILSENTGSGNDICEKINSSLKKFSDDKPIEDDITMLGIKFKE